MSANDEIANEECRACRGKGWRWIRKSRADAQRRIDGAVIDLVQLDCFECAGVGMVSAA
ncbi:hypothetical protein [Nonomuraea sp. NPDC050310]|uniref:hypothetical protein n=1 Tax=Nonomuraea sp. NPDC050310 TaxID=3154935 RepID=UPI0033DC36A1